MKHYLKCQLEALEGLEDKIEHATREIAQNIFADFLDYTIVMQRRNTLLQYIDNAVAQYRRMFSFEIYYPESRRLEIIKSDVEGWIEQQYKQEQEE